MDAYQNKDALDDKVVSYFYHVSLCNLKRQTRSCNDENIDGIIYFIKRSLKCH